MASETALDLSHSLRRYQWEGISFLLYRNTALLADEMGLGKTVQAAVALRLLLQQPNCRRALIVTPSSLRLNWERELAKWAPDLTVRRIQVPSDDRLAFYRLPIPVLIASYEQVRTDALVMHPSVRFDVVILDEAQRIKNSGSTTSLACRLLPRERSWTLTGTPLENRPADMAAIFRFLKPGLISPYLSRAEVHDRIRDSFLRRRKADVLGQLPPILIQDIPLQLEGEQLRVYQHLWSNRRQLLRSSNTEPSTAAMLGLITRLKQACNFERHSGESVKLESLQLILESFCEETDKVIVFSQYVKTLNWIAQRLTIPFGIFHGGLADVERDQVISEFENKPGPRALLMSLKAGGVGLSLQAASTVILFDRWWNPAVEQQAIQRAHRFGRHRPLHAFRFLVVDSIEERIAEILHEKQALFEDYVENAKCAQVKPFSRQELKRVLQIGSDLDS